MDFQRLRIKSVDDDDAFGSGRSYVPRNTSFYSDSDHSGSISVRDMIRHYDGNTRNAINNNNNVSRRQSHTTLHSRRPSFGGLVSPAKPRSQPNMLAVADENIGANLITNGRCCKNCIACQCCQNRNLKSSAAIQKFRSSETITDPHSNDALAAAGNSSQTDMQKSLEYKKTPEFVASIPPASAQPPNPLRTVMSMKNRLVSPSNDNIGEVTCHPIETSYQSKTTIAKTATGVRIIIDIFFDPEQQCVNASDILGSRVETDIPQSRILDEFQQQVNAAAATARATATTPTRCN
ncbi:uncharacterized protein LOC105261731 [Musca domestica]|uniref:Uncharacterized protein LOC105261731 n=1 Tax=Musca domestica TaxID=7370 RepID=A0A9J7D534_MUSDO|nr:uncharacterized protein LOC105261731 [Musca domestica]